MSGYPCISCFNGSIETVCTEINNDNLCASDTTNIYKRPFNDSENEHIFPVRKCINEC